LGKKEGSVAPPNKSNQIIKMKQNKLQLEERIERLKGMEKSNPEHSYRIKLDRLRLEREYIGVLIYEHKRYRR
jgi:hypothetical protein